MYEPGTMRVSREIMLKVLASAMRIDFRTVYFAETRPLAPEGSFRTNTLRHQRLIMPLTKTKRIRYAENGRVIERTFVPGEVLWVRPYAWTTELWDTDHTMLSVVFYERMVRSLFIYHDGVSRPPPGPNVFFHSSAPLDTCGNHLLQAVSQSGSGSSIAVRSALLGLLDLTRECVEHDHEIDLGKEAFTWDCLLDYLENNAFSPVSRENVAKVLRLHPAHLSRLVKKRSGCCFSEFLTRMRMERAAALLEDNKLTVDEIADLCGYNYTSYFIKVFRSYFVDSPARYREKRRHPVR